MIILITALTFNHISTLYLLTFYAHTFTSTEIEREKKLSLPIASLPKFLETFGLCTIYNCTLTPTIFKLRFRECISIDAECAQTHRSLVHHLLDPLVLRLLVLLEIKPCGLKFKNLRCLFLEL